MQDAFWRCARRPVIPALFGGVLASALFSQPLLAQGEDWKTEETDRINRYEGFIAQDAANPEWEVISFTGARPMIAEGSRLRVAFYLPSRLAGSGATTIVVARELDDREHYRMESKPQAWASGQWNVFDPWATSDVIDRREGLRSNLGVAVFPQQSVATAADVLPAFVAVSDGPLELSVTAYDVIMKSSRTVRSVTWRLDRVEGTAVVPVPGRGERLEGDFIRGVPIELRIPAPPSSGTYRLAICATPRLKLKEHQRPAGLCPKDDIERVYFFDHIPTVTVRAKSH